MFGVLLCCFAVLTHSRSTRKHDQTKAKHSHTTNTQIVDPSSGEKFASLLNTERQITPEVEKITGISQVCFAMLMLTVMCVLIEFVVVVVVVDCELSVLALVHTNTVICRSKPC